MFVLWRDELLPAWSWTTFKQTEEERYRKEQPEAGWHGWARAGVNVDVGGSSKVVERILVGYRRNQSAQSTEHRLRNLVRH